MGIKAQSYPVKVVPNGIFIMEPSTRLDNCAALQRGAGGSISSKVPTARGHY